MQGDGYRRSLSHFRPEALCNDMAELFPAVQID